MVVEKGETQKLLAGGVAGTLQILDDASRNKGGHNLLAFLVFESLCPMCRIGHIKD